MQIFSEFNGRLREIKNRDYVGKRKDEKMMEIVIPAVNKTLKRKRKNQEDEEKIKRTKKKSAFASQFLLLLISIFSYLLYFRFSLFIFC